MDEVIGKVLDQSFAEMHKRSSHASQRFADGSDNVAEQTRLLFLEEKFKMGTREAENMRRLDYTKTAQEVLQTRATKDQPQAGG